ncbi:acyl-CoA dehydrogenase family protein [Oceanobacillus damuensis]|uniref:acyl-CoA dehydrogenase family protein n=1 Tax=Oceanobacillus damuensis TaxID=937928 RepID=UPI00082B6CDE|nr:acyl-CoA dehydrogenase family protein [Oceanobacillus damuensis]
MKLSDLNTMPERKELLSQTVEAFSQRAMQHDENGTFPFENFEDLKTIGYPSLTVPKEYGGGGISLSEMLHYQEIIGKADGSTALSIGWHMGLMKHLGENNTWQKEIYAEVAQNVVHTGALLNAAASEPATGSPTRGGKPETYAREVSDGWIINGRKTFTTLSPILDYFIVSASIDGEDQVGNFLIKRERAGVKVDETWDSIAMRGTGSHDLVLENVHLDKEDLVERLTSGKKKPAGWLLHIPACYLGIASAAQEYAKQFATSYSPNSIQGTISDLPNVKQKLGEIELKMIESRYFLYGVAEKWDQIDEQTKDAMGPELGAAKLSAVNKAVEVVDLAMRIVGARSLSAKNPLQRYYRDVRAGLHNPPMDDMTIMQLAGK